MTTTSTSIAVFTSDLRLRDNPVLHAAVRSADQVVPLFVVDRRVAAAGFAVPNRVAFLRDCLADLDAGLRERGGRLIVRTGDAVEEIRRVAEEVGAGEVHIAGGVSGFAGRREERLREALGGVGGAALRVHGAVLTAVEPGAVTPSGGSRASGKDHFAVFTPYFRAWQGVAQRRPLAAPRRVRVPSGVRSEAAAVSLSASGSLSPGLPEGGERAGRRRLSAWLRSGLAAYADRQDDLAGDATSRLSPYLHFGCLSPVELVRRARESGGPGADAFVRQLAWRDFHHQVLAARPDASHADYRPRGDRWRSDESAVAAIAAWKAGRTGYPLVDAGMRQLAAEGWMHNRARLLVASFLTKTLYVDWRVGARHFLDLLVDGDVANNQLNWQWVAGTGTDTRPNRILNPLAQARRFDADGAYVRRWLPELADVPAHHIQTPWKLPSPSYPPPIVDLSEAAARFHASRHGG